MSSTPPAGGRLLVEPLEARIAPTGLTAIANNTQYAGSTDPYYVTYATAPSSTHLGFVAASKFLGASAPANVYAITLTGDGSLNSSGLSNGDKLLIYNSTTGFNENNPFLQATNRTIVAFFQDFNGDGQIQANELVGLALTKKSSANVNGNINGDIVTNLSKDGSTVSLTSVGSAGYRIAGLTINGNVTGDILAGGNISNVSVTGNINNVYAGTATNGHTFNFTGNAGTVSGTIAEGAFPDARVGASITDMSVTSLTSGATIHAGDGGLGAIGGAIDTLQVLQDTGAFNLVAGNGGVGNAAIKGGLGGAVNAVTVVGTADTIHNALISIHAGNGGENDAFKGGSGGTVSGVATSFNQGFDSADNTGSVSADFLMQNILVHAGDGGAGLKGGRGGDVDGSSIFSVAPDDGVVTGGVANAEIQVIAGHGGTAISTTQGHGGQGGGVSQVFAEDQNADVTNQDGSITIVTDSVLVQAGDGGAAQSGGSLSSVTLLAGQIVAQAGNGGSGINKGGSGGSLETINILNLTNLFTHQLTLNAGSGGASSAGSGGNGGEVNIVTMNDSDLNLLAINGGNGGAGGNGVGGAGGQLASISLTDTDVSGGFAHVTLQSGAGGNGTLGGGDGGLISQFQMFGFNFTYTATGGAGGSVLPGGAGGAGGTGGGLETVGFSDVPAVDTVAVGTALTDVLGANYAALTGTATAGAGGAGTTHGGAGGDLTGVDLRAGFDIHLTAGAGGNGGSDVAGAGGTVSSSAGVSLGGAVTILAGNAAGSGAAPGNGGGIAGTIASAQTDVTMIAGNGGAGGAGGDITSSGTSPNPLYFDFTFDAVGNEVTQNVSNFGNVTITAGNGNAGNGLAGAGGSVTGFTGSIGLGGAGDFSNAVTHTTAITAGTGGGGNGQTASGAGGNVTSLELTGSSLTDFFGGQIVTVDAGNAGVSTAAKRGGAGGGVATATIFNLDVGTEVQHLAAGDGATALKHGGDGGTITEVHVGRPGDTVADIGVRDGVAFGYAVGSAGGLFAGVGGGFTTTKPTAKTSVGQNGDVTNVTANAIASIVAGKSAVVHLVHEVDGIDLEGSTKALADATGAFTNIDTANLVGSIYNNGNGAEAAGASTFKQGDGLIAAITITNNINFNPEAALTYNSAGVLQFFDLLDPATSDTEATANVTNTIPVAYSL